jgi:hypothetical protein
VFHPWLERTERRGRSAAKLLQEMRDLIHSARSEVVQAVNSAMALHYCQVGRRIRTDILDSRRAAYGEEIVSTLSRQLSAEFGSGYSRPNLFRMIKCEEFFVDGEIASTRSRQLSWSHFIEIIRLKDALRRGLIEAGRWTGRSRRGSPIPRRQRRGAIEATNPPPGRVRSSTHSTTPTSWPH